ncbi:hypothetical protein K3495_g12818 [Podosphaera aphanis]|nr:hypothetical protein K3495_g12818 [Podosphaera aphanis]
MVLLSMTPCIVEALDYLNKNPPTVHEKDDLSATREAGKDDGIPQSDNLEESEKLQELEVNENRTRHINTRSGSVGKGITKILQDEQEPDLARPKVGNPIAHWQVIDLSTAMKSQSLNSYSLECLLRGSSIYVPPPPPKPEKVSGDSMSSIRTRELIHLQSPEYIVLMARLRQEEEARKYAQMINSSYSREKSSINYPTSSAANAFSSNHLPISNKDEEMTYSDINRQMALIFNVLISIVACGAAIWIAARWWSTPTRLAVSMSGSILVGVAEIVVYTGYIRRLSEAKTKEKAVEEVKEVVKSWVLGPNSNDNETESLATLIKSDFKMPPEQTGVRRRK